MNFKLFTFTLLLFLVSQIAAQDLEGVAIITLTSPVNKKLRELEKKQAEDSLKSSLDIWLSKMYPETFRNSTRATDYFKKKFIAECIKLSHKESGIFVRNFKTVYTLTGSTLDSLIASVNNKNTRKLQDNYMAMRNSYILGKYSEAFKSGLKSLYYMKIHLGEALKDDNGKNLFESAKSIIQGIIDTMDVSFSSPVITGKPSLRPDEAPSFSITYNGMPIPNFPLIFILPDSTEVLRVSSNKNGEGNLDQMKIPFVRKSSYLFVRPDIQTILGTDEPIELEALDVKNSENTDQSLMFNTIKTTYRLTYRVSKAGSPFTIPQSFIGNNLLNKFLTDSLPLTGPDVNMTPDLLIDISVKIINKENSKTETRNMSSSAIIEINSLRTGTQKVSDTLNLYEDSAELTLDFPLGLFFWETFKRMNKGIITLLNKL